MRIFLACPAPPRSLKGNRITAVRWARILKGLGHRLTIGQEYQGTCDLLVALHARKSHEAIRQYRRQAPDGPLVLCLTGTDLYHDLATSARARRSLELADRLVLLQAHGVGALPERVRDKARVIIQSAEPCRPDRGQSLRPNFDVAVLGHLRPVKDPFRAALALRHVPASSRLRVLQLGEALSPAMAKRARQLMAKDPRYQWRGAVPYRRARRILADSRLMVISSKLEGGANVICEALADGVPILASHMSGNIGLLGEDYPGYFTVGDTRALARLLIRAEEDARFYSQLKQWCQRLSPLVRPEREREAWRRLLAEFR